jgi:uncharacterized protein (TIGR02001 family)
MRSVKTSFTTLAAGVMLVAGTAHAGLTETITVATDYDFRGFSQTAQEPAVQGSIDYASDSGFYAGTWVSNVDFGDTTSYEQDLYAGFSGTAGKFGYDAGAIWYTYDESLYSYPEVYVSGAIGPFKAKFWYSPEFAGVNVDPTTLAPDKDSESAYYFEGNLTFPLNDMYTLLVHAGYSFGDYWDEAGKVASVAAGRKLDGEYLDYSVGLSATFGKFTTTFKYIDTDADIENTGKLFNNERRLLLTISTTFPWKE